MKENVRQLCELLVENRNSIKKCLFWSIAPNSYSITTGLLTAPKGIRVDTEKYLACRKMMKQKIGYFSAIRSYAMPIIETKMMMADDPEQYLQGVTEVYGKLREIHKLTASSSMVLAAMTIYEHAGVEGADADIAKLEQLYKALKDKHPLLVFDDDRPFLALVAASGIEPEIMVDRIETAYRNCKKLSINSDAVHSLAQILSLSDMDPESQHAFVKEMMDGIKKNHKGISKTFGLPAVGALTLLGISPQILVEEIVEVDNYLKGLKGFRWFDIDPRYRMVYSALAVFAAYADKNDKIASGIGAGVTTAIVDQLVTMIVIMATTTAVHASSSSSSSGS